MGIRFHKSIKLAKFLKLNVSKSGPSLSIGRSGASLNVGLDGKARATVGLPGTGLSYTKTFGTKKKKSSSKATAEKEKLRQEREAIKESKLKEQEAAAREAALQVEEYNNHIDLIRSVHLECIEDVDWKSLAGSADKKVSETADRILRGEVDAYLDVIEQEDPFEDLQEYGSDIEFGTDDPGLMEVEFLVNDVIPETEYSLTSTGKLSEKALSKSKYNDYLQDYVCSCSIRIARELFALLPVKNVLVHAGRLDINSATGREEEVTLLSVDFSRDGFENIHFDRIDPSDFLETFRHNMKFSKTNGFKPVERLE